MDGYGYTTYNGIEPCSGSDNDGWNKPSSGHVDRPVIVDAEGRNQPIIRYTPTTHKTETYLIETYVEHVAVMPPVIDHVPTTTTRTNPLSTMFRRLTASNSPKKSYNNITTTVDGDYDDYNDYNNNKNGGARDGYYRRRDDDPVVHVQPMVTNNGYYRRRDDNPVHEQPMVTNHGGRDRYYRHKDDDPVVHKQPMVTNHGDSDGYYRRDDPVVHKQPMVTNHGGGRDGYYRRKDDDPVHEQPMVTNQGGWTRPNRDGWLAPPPSHDSSLTIPMTEVTKAIEYLKEAERRWST